jgi:hypothetical protein
VTVHVQPPEDIDTDWGSLFVSVFNRMVSAGVIEPIPEDKEPGPWAADMPSWSRAAAEYHRDRAGRCVIVDIEPKRLAWLRGLMMDNVGIDRAWQELQRGRA